MCPVCRARFRGASTCSRCGADLNVVMALAASAWRMRQAARQALAAGEIAQARDLAGRAQQICYTPAGRRMEALSAWLGG
jgi:predicted amidophosphoribosyltransferase